MKKQSPLFILLILVFTSLSCSLPINLNDGGNNNSPIESTQPAATVPVFENTIVPSSVIPGDDPLLGEWSVFQVNQNRDSRISHDESQTWLGNSATINPDSMQSNQTRCLLTNYERSSLPDNYLENFPLDLSQYGIREEQVSLVRTNCAQGPFDLFLQLDAYTLLSHWQGSFLWLQRQTPNAPQRPIIFSNTHYLQEDITRNINVEIPQINRENPASENFNNATFVLFKDIMENFITDTENWERIPEQDFPASELELTFDVHWNDGQRISILGRVNTYYAGAAHPNTFFTTFNYDLNANKILTIEDFFLPESDYLNFLLNTSTFELQNRDIGFFEGSLSAEAIYFQNLTFTPAGLMVHFSPYDVASYAAGPQMILIPYADLDGYLNPAYFPPAAP